MPAGRPKGQPKFGGRQAGTPNKVTADIKALARSHCAAAIEKLVDLMNGKVKGKDVAHATQAAAALSLLDRGFGKPAQQTIVTGDDENGPVRHVFSWEGEDADR